MSEDMTIVTWPELSRILHVKNRETLNGMIAKRGFPAPLQLTSKLRAWRLADVESWLAARASEAKAE